MKIVQVTKSKVLIEMEHDEIKYITDKTLYGSDLKKLCEEETVIPLGKWSTLFRDNSSHEIKRAVTSLESASKFLNNQFEELLRINK